jgi:phage terminase large subunit-like protein
MDEAWSNLRRTTRLGYARTIWDTTPRRRHPIIRELIARSEMAPDRHIVIRGETRANVANLNADAVSEWYDELGGTVRGREELLGEYVGDDEGALVRIEWIDSQRMDAPAKLERRVIAVDPAISMRRSTDATGIVIAGIDDEEQLYVLADLSGRHPWEHWGELVVDRYMAECCDCVVLERNRGGDAVAANIRAIAGMRGIAVAIAAPRQRTRHDPRRIYVREVIARQGKESRADPVATLYQRGRVHHIFGANLSELEDQWTSWNPASSMRSPNALDACVWALWELAGIGDSSARIHRTQTADGLSQLERSLGTSAGAGRAKAAAGSLRLGGGIGKRSSRI